MSWSTACTDWQARLLHGQTIIPEPIHPDMADRALRIFRALRVPDLPGKPTFGECCDEWVFRFVAAIFGAYDAETGRQHVREAYLLIAKKNTKSTVAAGIMLTALLLCWREEEEHLILAPTKEVAGNSFGPAAAMVRADEQLSALLHVQDHIRTITHRTKRNTLKVVAADSDTVSGKKAGRILVDEHWLFGKRADADAMFIEALGGQVSRDEGFVIYLTTQSDEPPAGVFADKLAYARDVRDGKVQDSRFLPVLYEFPPDMIASGEALKPEHFHIVNPNLGRSVSAEWLEDEMRKRRGKTDGSFERWCAKHLNIQVGMSKRADNWAGAEFWARCADRTMTLDALLARADVAVLGIDGGGLDDLLGLAVMGRCRESGAWLVWAHAWAHRIVLERRKEVAPALQDFAADGDLTLVDEPGEDVRAVADIACRVRDAGLLPETKGIGVDSAGIGDIVDELLTEDRGFVMEDIVGISQGWRLTGAIKTVERKLAGGEMRHSGSRLMAWSVGNARCEPKGNAVTITKQISGSAKIDPLMALFDAASLMALAPKSGGRSFWDTEEATA